MSILSYSKTDSRLALRAKHLDAASNIVREFIVMFYPDDSTVEIADVVGKKQFLKRCAVPTLSTGHFFIGAEVVLVGRLFIITDYADKVTQQLCERVAEDAIIVLSGADLVADSGRALDVVTQECGFAIRSMHVLNLRRSDWSSTGATATQAGSADVAAEQHAAAAAAAGTAISASGVVTGLASFLPTSFAEKPALILFVIRNQALAKAAGIAPRLCRADPSKVWVSGSRADVHSAAPLFELAIARPSASFNDPNSTVVAIKPTAISQAYGGEIIRMIMAQAKAQFNVNLTIQALSQVSLPISRADQYVQPLKGVLGEFRAIVEDLASGPLWALQFVAGDAASAQQSIVNVVRDVCGPFDPVVARVLRPNTVRAKFGSNVVQNAVHCCDLEDDGPDDAAVLWAKPALMHLKPSFETSMAP